MDSVKEGLAFAAIIVLWIIVVLNDVDRLSWEKDENFGSAMAVKKILLRHRFANFDVPEYISLDQLSKASNMPSSSVERGFERIASLEESAAWIESLILDSPLFSPSQYLSPNLRMVGSVRIRQLRVKEEKGLCSLGVKQRCGKYPQWSSSANSMDKINDMFYYHSAEELNLVADVQPYNWESGNEKVLAVTRKLTRTPMSFKSFFSGRSYGSGGYAVDLPTGSRENAINVFQRVREGGFFASSPDVRLLVLEFTAFNVMSTTFVNAQFYIEFLPEGMVVQDYRIRPFNLAGSAFKPTGKGSTKVFKFIVAGGSILGLVVYLRIIYIDAKKSSWSRALSGWRVIDIVSLIFVIATLSIQVSLSDLGRAHQILQQKPQDSDNPIWENLFKNGTLCHCSYFELVSGQRRDQVMVAGIACITMSLKVFKFFAIGKRRMLLQILKLQGSQILSWIVVFFIATISFAIFSHIIYGERMMAFRTISAAFVSNTLFLFKDFNQNVNPANQFSGRPTWLHEQTDFASYSGSEFVANLLERPALYLFTFTFMHSWVTMMLLQAMFIIGYRKVSHYFSDKKLLMQKSRASKRPNDSHHNDFLGELKVLFVRMAYRIRLFHVLVAFRTDPKCARGFLTKRELEGIVRREIGEAGNWAGFGAAALEWLWHNCSVRFNAADAALRAFVNIEANADDDGSIVDAEDLDWITRAYQGRAFIDPEVAMDIIMDDGASNAADDAHIHEAFDKLLHSQKALDASLTFNTRDDFDRLLNVKSDVESDVASGNFLLAVSLLHMRRTRSELSIASRLLNDLNTMQHNVTSRLFALQDRVDEFERGTRLMEMRDPWKHSKHGVYKNAEGLFEAHCRTASIHSHTQGKLRHVFVGAYESREEAVRAMKKYKDLAEARALMHHTKDE